MRPELAELLKECLSDVYLRPEFHEYLARRMDELGGLTRLIGEIKDIEDQVDDGK